MSTEIKDERWFYCSLCHTAAYDFECCENTSCNAGGCDHCEDRYEINLRIVEGDHPPLGRLRGFTTREHFSHFAEE